MEAKILITNLTMNGDGFGVVPETGESVYIPPGVAKASAIVTGEYREAKLVPNTPARAAQTPLMGVFIKPAPAVVYAEDDVGLSDDAILDLFEEVEDDGLYPQVLTTTGVADASNTSAVAVRPVLDRLFRQGLLARADVFHGSERRACMVLWAKQPEDFA